MKNSIVYILLILAVFPLNDAVNSVVCSKETQTLIGEILKNVLDHSNLNGAQKLFLLENLKSAKSTNTKIPALTTRAPSASSKEYEEWMNEMLMNILFTSGLSDTDKSVILEREVVRVKALVATTSSTKAGVIQTTQKLTFWEKLFGKSSRLAALTDDQVKRYAKILGTTNEKIRAFELKYRAFNVAKEGNLDKQSFNDWLSSFYAEKNHAKFGFHGQSNAFAQQMFDLFDVNKDGNISFEEFLSGSISLTSEDKKTFLDTLFKIIDSDKNGLISQSDIEKIMIATRELHEGDNYGAFCQNTFEKNGREDAEFLMAKLDDKKTGKGVTKEKFISTISAMTTLPNGRKYYPGTGTGFNEFQNRFNIDKQINYGSYYAEPGKKPIPVGDLIKK